MPVSASAMAMVSATEEVDWKRKEVRERLGSVGRLMGCLGEEYVIVLRLKQFLAIVATLLAWLWKRSVDLVCLN